MEGQLRAHPPECRLKHTLFCRHRKCAARRSRACAFPTVSVWSLGSGTGPVQRSFKNQPKRSSLILTAKRLPTAWHEQPAGAYSTEGYVPDIPNVTLVPGWFEETVKLFFEDNPAPIRLANID